MTKRHFAELARILGKHDAAPELVNDVMALCAAANPKFDTGRFVTAVNAARPK